MECQDCGDEIDADDVVRVKVGRRTMKLCEDCAEVRLEEAEIDAEALGAMQDMMGYKGR